MSDQSEKFEKIEARLSKIENRIVFVTGIFFILGALGFGLTYWVNHIQESIPSEERLQAINEGITAHAKEVTERGLLANGFSQHSVLGQVQAQAACIAMAPAQTTVQAINRSHTSIVDGHGYSETCDVICAREIPSSVGNRNPAVVVGALHIYDSVKPYTDRLGTFTKTMATHKYSANDRNKGFGPNYCCCAG